MTPLVHWLFHIAAQPAPVILHCRLTGPPRRIHVDLCPFWRMFYGAW